MLANKKVLDKASYCKLDHYFFDITTIVLVLLYLSESLGISISLCFYKRNLKLFLTASQYSMSDFLPNEKCLLANKEHFLYKIY